MLIRFIGSSSIKYIKKIRRTDMIRKLIFID